MGVKKRMPVSARYDGENGLQHGYIKGKVYTTQIYDDAAGQIIVMPGETAIGHEVCSYPTFREYLLNWTEVSALKG